MQEDLDKILKDYSEKITATTDLKILDEIYLSLFGKNGEITLIPKSFPTLPKDDLKEIAPLFKTVKSKLETQIEERRVEVREESYKKLIDEKVNLDTPLEEGDYKGQIHPITQFEEDIAQIFSKIGFQRFDAPHIDNDFENFEVLNIPAEHPARDLWDTLYIEQEKSDKDDRKLLLRTHTSNAQVRIMREHQVPFRMMIIDRCFRYENLDARHEHTLDQFEIVYVDKNLSMANLQYLSEIFLKNMFGREIKVRLRPKYYPFVEPGVGVDGMCIFCEGKGCNICSGVGWLELAGAGMIHPQVLKNGGIDPQIYSGIAWGFGPERMAMLKFGVEDIRLFKSGDLKALHKVGKEDR